MLAARILVKDGRLDPQERIVMFNTGSATKYRSADVPQLPTLPADGTIDFMSL